MAGIDKTYCNNYKDYYEVIEWMKNHKFKCPNDMILDPLKYIYYQQEENFNGKDEIPIMNTTCELDYFLIRECPLDIIQERMKEVYSEEYYNSVKNGKSNYDSFNPLPSGTKIRLIKNSKLGNKNPFKYRIKNKILYHQFVEVYNKDNDHVWYNEDYDKFVFPEELGYFTSSCADIYVRSFKALLRKIRNWKLPKGCIIKVSGRFVGENWIFKIL